MSRSKPLADFDVITGPPMPGRPIVPAGLPNPPAAPVEETQNGGATPADPAAPAAE